MSAHAIYSLIAANHSPPEWACFPEVPSGTGGGRRRIDALCCNLWRSRGYEVRGIEIKVSKADFRRELREPDKADDVARYCDTFWIAAPKGMVDPKELPLTWGLFEATEDAIRIKVKATAREPAGLTRPFIASLFRACQKTLRDMERFWVPRTEIQDLLNKAEEQGKISAPREAQRTIKDLEDKIACARPVLAELGIDLDDWSTRGSESGENLATCLRVGRIMLGGHEKDGSKYGQYHSGLCRVADQLDTVLQSVTDAKKRVEAMKLSTRKEET